MVGAAFPKSVVGGQPVWCWVEGGRDLGIVGFCHETMSLVDIWC